MKTAKILFVLFIALSLMSLVFLTGCEEKDEDSAGCGCCPCDCDEDEDEAEASEPPEPTPATTGTIPPAAPATPPADTGTT